MSIYLVYRDPLFISFLILILCEYLIQYIKKIQKPVTLQDNKTARISTLCALYFAQGFPWGFMLTAVLSYLSENEVSTSDIGALSAMALLPWTFKLLWAPLIDSFNYPAMGRRRPWILFAQLMMAVTLITMAMQPDLINNLTYLGWMFFLHNCFASLQDVCTDALAVDILLPEERGKVNGFMWGSKTIGMGVGGAVMGTLLANTSMNFTLIFQTVLVLLVMLFPLLLRERAGEKLLPWTKGKIMLKNSIGAIRNPLNVVKDIIRGFSVKTTFIIALFLLFASIGDGINGIILKPLYTQILEWDFKSYSQVEGSGAIFEFFGAILGGFLADRIGRKKIIMIGYGGFGITALLFGYLSVYWHLEWFASLYLIIPLFFRALGTVAVFSLCMNISWTKSAATMFTCYMAMSNISTMIGQRIAGPLNNSLSYEMSFILLGSLAIIPLILIFFVNTEKSIEESY